MNCRMTSAQGAFQLRVCRWGFTDIAGEVASENNATGILGAPGQIGAPLHKVVRPRWIGVDTAEKGHRFLVLRKTKSISCTELCPLTEFQQCPFGHCNAPMHMLALEWGEVQENP